MKDLNFKGNMTKDSDIRTGGDRPVIDYSKRSRLFTAIYFTRDEMMHLNKLLMYY